MSSFTVGSIVAYMGKSSPDGWIICDGNPTDNSDNKYDSLIELNIGTSNATTKTYTPPNLMERFLLDEGEDPVINVNTARSSDTVTLSTTNLPSHTHVITATQSSHNHYLANFGTSDKAYSGGGGGIPFGFGNFRSNTAQPAIAATASSVGGGAAFYIIPPFASVNYILKY
jgi:microcystin-dependent protein